MANAAGVKTLVLTHTGSRLCQAGSKEQGIAQTIEWLQLNELGNEAINYKIRDWLMTDLEYQYISKHASDKVYETSEYDSNVLSFQINVLF